MKTIYFFDVFATKVGPITVVVDEDRTVTELWTDDRSAVLLAMPNYTFNAGAVAKARTQVQEYAEGDRRSFELELRPAGTEFQRTVWNMLLQIPYGETRSYGELAMMIGNPKASRAVGRANGTNPISIIIPCHRVIGSAGSLTGYGGGLPMKRMLLELEGSWTGQLQLLNSE